jgi:hypothetical protein
MSQMNPQCFPFSHQLLNAAAWVVLRGAIDERLDDPVSERHANRVQLCADEEVNVGLREPR